MRVAPTFSRAIVPSVTTMFKKGEIKVMLFIRTQGYALGYIDVLNLFTYSSNSS
jgi:hypothetical protein